MRVLVWPADEGGCGHNRIIWPIQSLQAQGVDVWLGPEIEAVCAQPGDIEHVLAVPPIDADVVVLQRRLRRWWIEAIPLIQAQGAAVVLEIDDDFHALPRGHIERSSWTPERNARWLRRCCELADLVTVTTPALAERYAQHGRFVVLPNCVPERYLSVEPGPTGNPVIIGWPGSVNTHLGDLEQCGTTVASLCRETGARLHAVGSRRTGEVLGVPNPIVTPWVSLADYPHVVASFDVGIAPLAPTRFNEAKSALKMMEYAACGVAGVGSPTPDNRRMFVEGVGLLAGTPAEWHIHLAALVGSAEYRAEVAGRSREAMRAWTYEGRCEAWWNAWTLARRSYASMDRDAGPASRQSGSVAG